MKISRRVNMCPMSPTTLETPPPNKLLPWIQVRASSMGSSRSTNLPSSPKQSRLRSKLQIKLNLPDLDVPPDLGAPAFLPATPRSAKDTAPWYIHRTVSFSELQAEAFIKSSHFVYQEFAALSHVGREQSRSNGMAAANAKKNRYANIYPYNETRVILRSTASNVMGYINASFITVGNKKPNKYIAAQGPLANTYSEFWSMLWQTQAEAVVMLTRVEDDNRRKVCAYWNSALIDGLAATAGIDVSIKHVETRPGYIERTFVMTDGETTREISQYQFLEWPDHDVPDRKAIIDFRRHVRQRHRGLLVVHCSAGVGRTGTFCAIDVLLSRLGERDSINIPGTVATLRQHRMYMCQTLEQYSFIYDVMREAIKALKV